MRAVAASLFGVACAVVLSGCSGFERDPVADLSAVTVVADNAAAADAGTDDGQALRVAVPGESTAETMESTTTTVKPSTSSPSLTSSTVVPTTAVTAVTMSTMSTTATTADISGTDPSTTANPSPTSGTDPVTSSTEVSQPVINFPAIEVTRHGSGQVVSLADQVAGSRPVLVWFWLPG